MADRRRGLGRRTGLLALLAATLLSCSAGVEKKEPDTIYLPTPPAAVAAMLRLAAVTDKDTVYDLGSGDGRIVIAAARDFHARAVGVELDPALVRLSRDRAAEAGQTGRAAFIQADIFKVDLKGATVVTLYLLPGPDMELIPKLLSELKPGSRVVSHMHDMGDWKPDRTIRVGDSTIYLWVVPADVYGRWDVTVDAPGGPVRGTMFVRQTYQELQGTMSAGGFGSGGFHAVLDGRRFAFPMTGSNGHSGTTLQYRGRAVGDVIEGDVLIKGAREGETGRYAWRARRPSGGMKPFR